MIFFFLFIILAEEDAVPGNAYKMIPDTRRRELKEGESKKKIYLHTDRKEEGGKKRHKQKN